MQVDSQAFIIQVHVLNLSITVSSPTSTGSIAWICMSRLHCLSCFWWLSYGLSPQPHDECQNVFVCRTNDTQNRTLLTQFDHPILPYEYLQSSFVPCDSRCLIGYLSKAFRRSSQCSIIKSSINVVDAKVVNFLLVLCIYRPSSGVFFILIMT